MTVVSHESVDQQFQQCVFSILDRGIKTKGRTKTRRIRLIDGHTFKYNMSNSKMNMFTLRKNNPDLAIAETLAFIMGADNVSELVQAHPALALWENWAAKDGSLGGVYGEAFNSQFKDLINNIIKDPLSTHHRLTTLIPSKFPIKGNTYDENVKAGKFSLMPCLHSYHFLSDGESISLHATQGSGDIPIGVFPHNSYQVQFMLLLVAKLTGLKPSQVTHNVHDVHIYENQLIQVDQLLKRKATMSETGLTFHHDLTLENLLDKCLFEDIKDMFKVGPFPTYPELKIEVDS